MIEVYNRISEIFARMEKINNRFSKQQHNSTSFKNKLVEIQEKIYQDKLDVTAMTKYDDIIENNAKKYSIPKKLIKSVIKQESNFNPKAISPKGAKGLMQLMPETADFLGVRNVFNPAENIEAGVKYLKMMLNKFGGNVEEALAAYNAGPEIVERNNGIPDYAETKDYIKNVLSNLETF